MNLLIVDDEEITREGIIERLPWSELGIHQIQQADDGINALTLVENYKPSIVLTDVRMPRMDGIQMAIKLKEIFPHCVIIFMSGYSDKEYLKAAIQLNAVDYVDKPISIKELKSAVENAVKRFRETEIKELAEHVTETYMKVSIPLLRSELAHSLLKSNLDLSKVIEEARAACIELPTDGFYQTAIFKFLLNEKNSSEHLSSIKAVVLSALENGYSKYRFNGISAFKNEDCLILHLFAGSFERHLFTEDRVSKFLNDLRAPLEKVCNFTVSIGKCIHGAANIYTSYETAVSGLERAFFKEYNSILFYGRYSNSQHGLEDTLVKNFIELVDGERLEESIFFIKSLISDLRSHDNTPVNNIKIFSILFCLN